jgi:hypothetical protein
MKAATPFWKMATIAETREGAAQIVLICPE